MTHTFARLLGFGLQHLLLGECFAGSPPGLCFPQLDAAIAAGMAIGDLCQVGTWARHKRADWRLGLVVGGG